MKKVGIIIPAHNEEERIKDTLKSYLDYFGNLKKNGIIDFEIIVVLNACTDNTCVVVEECRCLEINILDYKQGGKGFAVTEGFKESLRKNHDIIGFVDADGATPPSAFYGLIRNLKKNQGIMGNRWDKGSKVLKQKFLRRILSRGFNVIVRILFLFPYQDTQCGAKVFKREALRRIIKDLYITHWAFDINLLYSLKKMRFKVIEIPTEWIDKIGSKVNVKKAPIMMFIGIIRLRLLNSPLKGIVKMYDRLPEVIKFHHKWM